jgi:adenylate kinase
MIIGISGSVGSGKTTIGKKLSKILNYDFVPLNEKVKEYKIKDVNDLQTFDFDFDKFYEKFEDELKIFIKKNKNTIFEGHFAHFIDKKYVDLLFIISKDLSKLKEEYKKRNYNEKKIKENLEVEALNLCFFEAIENGYENEKNLFLIENNDDLDSTISKILKIVKNNMK